MYIKQIFLYFCLFIYVWGTLDKHLLKIINLVVGGGWGYSRMTNPCWIKIALLITLPFPSFGSISDVKDWHTHLHFLSGLIDEGNAGWNDKSKLPSLWTLPYYRMRSNDSLWISPALKQVLKKLLKNRCASGVNIWTYMISDQLSFSPFHIVAVLHLWVCSTRTFTECAPMSFQYLYFLD